MLRFSNFVVLLLLLLFSFLLLPYSVYGKWGGEVSTNLNSFALIKSFSLKNELFLRMQYDWTEYFKDKEQQSIHYHYQDTLYDDEEYTYTYDEDHSYKNFSLEVGYRKFLGSGKGFSTNLGLSFKVSPGSTKDVSIFKDEYGSSEREETVKWNDMSINFDFGFRYLFNQHFAATIHNKIVSYVWSKKTYKDTYLFSDGDSRITETTNNSQYLQSEVSPHIFVVYYF